MTVERGFRLTRPCFRRSGTGTIRRWCRFRLLRRSHPPPCRRDLRNRPNTNETSQAHPRPRASKTTCAPRDRGAAGRRRSSHHRREAPDGDAAGSPDARRPPHPSHVRFRPCLHHRWRRCAALRRGLRNHRGWATGAGASGRAFRVQADARRILAAAAVAFPRESRGAWWRGSRGRRA